MGPKAGGSLNRSNWNVKKKYIRRNTYFNIKRKYMNFMIIKYIFDTFMWVYRRKKMEYTLLISSRLCISGESPPWTHRNCWFMSAASGRQSNASIQASYTRSEYFILPESFNKKKYIILYSYVLIATNIIVFLMIYRVKAFI